MATYIVPDDYATINLALQATSHTSQDTVRVRAGTYAADFDFRKASVGGWIVPTILEAYDPENKPIITGGGSAQVARKDSVYNGGAAGLIAKMKNLKFDGCTSASNGVVYGLAAMNIEGCEFVNTTTPVIKWAAGDATRVTYIEECIFNATTNVAITFTGVTDYCTVRNCEITRTAAATSAIFGTTADGNVYNTSVYVNRTAGSWNAVTAKIVTNVTVQNAGSVTAGAISSNTYTTCLAYGSFTTAFSGANGGGNISGSDPLYTDGPNGDLLPQSGSPLINAGTNLSGTGFTDSLNGVARPSGAAWDIGAYEVEASTTVSSVTVLGPTSIQLNLAATVSSDATWTDAGNYLTTPNGGAAAVTVVAAANPTPTTIVLTTTEHTGGGSYDVSWSGLTNITTGNLPYTGQGVAPSLASLVVTSSTTFRATFSEAMRTNAPYTNVANYAITDVTGGAPIVTTSVGQISNTQVSIQINTPMIGGRTYRLTGTTNLTDAAYNPLDAAVTVTAVRQSVPTAAAADVGEVEVTFDTEVDPSVSAIDETATYTFTLRPPYLGGSGALTKTGVVVPNPSSTAVVEVEGMIQGQNYTVTLASTTATTSASLDFVGAAVQPGVDLIGALPRGVWGGG